MSEVGERVEAHSQHSKIVDMTLWVKRQDGRTGRGRDGFLNTAYFPPFLFYRRLRFLSKDIDKLRAFCLSSFRETRNDRELEGKPQQRKYFNRSMKDSKWMRRGYMTMECGKSYSLAYGQGDTALEKADLP